MQTVGATWYEPLNAFDATFLAIESPRAHMHICGVFVLDGRAPALAELTAHVAARLDRIPRYRQRLASDPIGLGRPVWIDDAGFRIERHVRAETLPRPGGHAALRRLAARAFSEPLAHDAPLWELTLVDGVAEDRFAIVWKTHHCVLDGIAFLDVVTALTDEDARGAAPASARPWMPRPAPPGATLLAASVQAQLAEAVGSWGAAWSRSADARRAFAAMLSGWMPLVELGREGRARASSLNQPIGSRRRWDMLVLDLDALRHVRASLGGTINDVVLAVAAGALRTLLAARGEDLREDLRAYVPVNLRPPGAVTGGNQIGGIHCPLPIGERDPVARLRAISAAMARRKESRAAFGTASLVRLADLVPARFAAEAARREVAYRRFNLIVSNVPGPKEPRWLLGRRLRSLHFGVPLPENQTLSVQFFSYAGTVGVGLLADADRAPDLAMLAAAIPEALGELRAACPAA